MKIDDEKYGRDGKIGHSIHCINVRCCMTQKDKNTLLCSTEGVMVIIDSFNCLCINVIEITHNVKPLYNQNVLFIFILFHISRIRNDKAAITMAILS